MSLESALLHVSTLLEITSADHEHPVRLLSHIVLVPVAAVLLLTVKSSVRMVRPVRRVLLMQVCFSTQLDTDSHAFGWTSVTKATGGEVSMADGSVALRILIDHSAVEIFSGCGQALTSR